MDAQKLQLVLLARIAGEVNPETYVDAQLSVVADPKAVASKKVRVYIELVDLGHKNDDGKGYLTPVVKREITIKLVDGTTTTEIVG